MMKGGAGRSPFLYCDYKDLLVSLFSNCIDKRLQIEE